MKTLVTGAGGFLGQALVRKLQAHGENNLRLFLRPGSSAPRHSSPCEQFIGSLIHPADCDQALEGVDTVYHLAAAKSGSPAELFLHTVVGTRNLIDAVVRRAPERRPRVVLVSSFSVYGVASLPRDTVVNELTPLEKRPTERDPYAMAKLRQERLVRELAEHNGLDVVFVRPGVIYGPGGVALPSRVGLDVFGLFLALGGDNVLPLTYVDNCADALHVAGMHGRSGEVFNVVDDALPTCRQYLDGYRRSGKRMWTIPVPYWATQAISTLNAQYSRRTHNQLPPILTPYKSRALWGGNRFENARLKALGWTPRVSIAEGLERTFGAL